LEGVKRDYNDELENQEPLENENIKAGNLPGQKPKDEEEETEEPAPKKDSVITVKSKIENADKNIKKPENISDVKNTKTEESISVKNDSASAVKEITEKFKKNEATQDIVFKVQFASSDTELNLKESRFTAIKNGSYYKVNSVLKYTSGQFNTVAEAATHQNELRQNGFKDCFMVAFKNGMRIDINEAKKLTEQKQ